MCGIVAIHSPKRAFEPGALERATAALVHRGPDGNRTWRSGSGAVGLGHTRLAIIDPDAAQPLRNEDGRLHLVVNGEFYDFEEARRDLMGRGHELRTRSDSEIAIHLYEELGTSCLRQLRGQFAFALWDGRRNRLFAARDRFGIKPLFYAQVDEVLYLASEAKALFAAGVQARWDPVALYHSIHACPDETRSLFEGIRQVPPGHFLLSDRDGVRLERYWDIAAPGKAGEAMDAHQRVESARRHVVDAVTTRLRADVPVGCLLSGGLDSSAVLGIASRHSDRAIAAFTVGFNDPDYDERSAARVMADHAGAKHYVIHVGDQEMADHFADAVWHAENVQYNSHGTARFLLSRAVRDAGYKSVMAGEGADEVFYGYEFTRAAARASSRTNPLKWLRMLPRFFRAATKRHAELAAASPWLARLATLLDAPPALLGRLTGGLTHLRSLMTPQFKARFDGYDVYHTIYRRCAEAADLKRREPASRMTYLWFHSLFVNYHLAADRLDMAHGVEVRFPFLDHILFEAMNEIPPRILATSDPEKRLLRDAVRPYVHDDVFRRTKKPFWAPPRAAGVANPIHELVQDTLRGSAMIALPFFDQSRVVEMLDSLPGLDDGTARGTDSLLLMLTSMCVLGERYAL